MSVATMIVGPVGCGKSNVSAQLCKVYPNVAVSPDSYPLSDRRKNERICEAVTVELNRSKNPIIDNGGRLFTESLVSADFLVKKAASVRLYAPQELIDFCGERFNASNCPRSAITMDEFRISEHVAEITNVLGGAEDSFNAVKELFLRRTEQTVNYRIRVGKYITNYRGRDRKFGHFPSAEEAHNVMREVTIGNLKAQISLIVWCTIRRIKVIGFSYNDETHEVTINA